ncbi:MAG: DUF3313 domain-containing protein [Thermodesulfobacteriota bacterium]|nr:DUF3313 domain-containing protein [Thermodesulfobacteriota bacterium]
MRRCKSICIWLIVLAVSVGLLVSTGCAVGVKKRPSGFLGDYSSFRTDPEDPDIFFYEKPGVDWKRFKSLQIDPILVYYKPDARDRQIDPNTLKKMTDYFGTALVKAVEDKYPVVTEPGPHVLRIRAAITELDPSNVLVNVVTSVALLSVDMGGAAMEAEFLDSETGERLAAIVHKRMGTPIDMVGSYSKWGHAKAAFDYWARELRKGLDGPEPEEK